MKIEECWQELQMEKDRHQQTLRYYNQLRALYYRETGINFVPKEIDPSQVRPGFFRRFARVVWPFRLFVK
jgi:hypothetical protein